MQQEQRLESFGTHEQIGSKGKREKGDRKAEDGENKECERRLTSHDNINSKKKCLKTVCKQVFEWWTPFKTSDPLFAQWISFCSLGARKEEGITRNNNFQIPKDQVQATTIFSSTSSISQSLMHVNLLLFHCLTHSMCVYHQNRKKWWAYDRICFRQIYFCLQIHTQLRCCSCIIRRDTERRYRKTGNISGEIPVEFLC